MACNNCTGTCSGACGQPKLPTGVKGADGKNSYTFLAANFTMPAVGSNVTITVQNTGQFTNKWAGVGSIIFIETAGYFEVVSLTGTNQITIENLGYPSNAAPTTNILTGVLVQTSGIRGEAGTGTAGVDGTSVLYWLGNDDFADSISGTGTFTDFFANYTLLANELAINGDEIEVVALVRLASFPSSSSVRILFAGSSLGTVTANFASNFYLLKFRVKRISNDTIYIQREVTTYLNNGTSSTTVCSTAFLPAQDFTVTNLIKLQINQADADFVLFGQFTIYKYKKV